jgi:hypothetical protein
VRELARKILKRYNRLGGEKLSAGYRSAEIRAVLDWPPVLSKQDVQTLFASVGEHGKTAFLETYRRAVLRSGNRWTAMMGTFYVLGGLGDETSRADIIAAAIKSQNPEIREVYEDIRRLKTFQIPLPELPPLV